LTIKNHDIEIVWSLKHFWIEIDYTNDETEEMKARILAAINAYSSLQTILDQNKSI